MAGCPKDSILKHLAIGLVEQRVKNYKSEVVRRISCLLLLLALLLADTAWACRCAQQNLADYFNAADQVLIAELKAVTDLPESRRLEFALMGPYYKGGGDTAAEETVHFSTEKSSAGCGIEPDIGAMYVIFAHAPAKRGEDYRVDSCSGTRVHFSPSLPEPQGFADVPARFVAQQLNGLAGMEVLKSVSANYPRADNVENESPLGLLDIKDLHHGGTVPLYTRPDLAAPVLETVVDYAPLETREISYEQPAAVVYTRLPDWYRLRLLDGRSAWLASEQAGTFFDYAQLPVNRLAYLTRNWSGFVWPDPGAGLPIRHGAIQNADLREFPVDILESTEVGGTIWFRVKVLASDPCSNLQYGNELVGWIPAYGANGQPNAWFYSRGC
jgi:hypothetical protein